MKPTTIIFALLASACGAAYGDCGDLQHSQELDGPGTNECMVVEIADGSDGFVALDNECPSSRCVVVMPGDTFRVWKETLADEPEYSAATLDFVAGECRVSCPEE